MRESFDAPATGPTGPARHRFRPRTASSLDAVALIALLLALCVVFFGPVRLTVGGVRFSATTPWTLLGLALLIGAIRLSVVPQPTPRSRAAAAAHLFTDTIRRAETRAIARIWLATRLGVVLIGFAAVATVGLPAEAPAISRNPLLNLAYRWDSGWYLAIATNGYHWDPVAGAREQQSIAFFPAYPLLMRAGGAILGARAPAGSRTLATLERLQTRTLIAGWLLALLASYAALHALFRWASAVTDRRTALRAVALLSVYPFAIYYSAAYTEALFLLGSLGAFNGVRTGHPARAGAWGLLAGLVRPNGFLLTLPLLILAARSGPRWRWGLAAAMPTLGMLIYSAYLWSTTGDPLVWLEAHAAWGRVPPTWNTAVARPLEDLASEGLIGYAIAAPYQLLNGAAFVFALALLPVVWRRLGAAPAVLVLVMVGPPLAAGGLMSLGRVTSTVFPLFVALAQVLPRRYVTPCLVACALAQGFAAVLFFTWRPLV